MDSNGEEGGKKGKDAIFLEERIEVKTKKQKLNRSKK